MNKFEKTLAFIREVVKQDSPFYEKIYLVGGCVRDELLGERYTDLDLLIDLPNGQKEFVEWMCQSFPDTCKGPFYYQRYGTTAMDVVIDKAMTLVECVEPHIETYAEDGQTLLETRFCSLEEDANRRDYTCNALYKNLHTGKIIDPTGRGIADLKAKVLCTPLDPAVIYKQDPVRMLRGIRFKNQKGFTLDANAWRAINECHEGMALALPKRMRDELNKMLKSKLFGTALCDMYYANILQYVMPGLEERISKPKIRPYLVNGMNSWQHTLRALSVQGREHPHTDTTMKLAVLVCHMLESEGRIAVIELLRQCQIGKEKATAAVHMAELYWRYASFFEKGKYIARPRMLPHFVNGVQNSLNEFRRMVRALNSGLKPEYMLPIEPLISNVECRQNAIAQMSSSNNPQQKAKANKKQKNKEESNENTEIPELAEPIKAKAKSKANARTRKRKEQRRRAKCRMRIAAEQQLQQQQQQQ